MERPNFHTVGLDTVTCFALLLELVLMFHCAVYAGKPNTIWYQEISAFWVYRTLKLLFWGPHMVSIEASTFSWLQFSLWMPDGKLRYLLHAGLQTITLSCICTSWAFHFTSGSVMNPFGLLMLTVTTIVHVATLYLFIHRYRLYTISCKNATSRESQDPLFHDIGTPYTDEDPLTQAYNTQDEASYQRDSTLQSSDLGVGRLGEAL